MLQAVWHTFRLQHISSLDIKGDFAFQSSQTNTFKRVKGRKKKKKRKGKKEKRGTVL